MFECNGLRQIYGIELIVLIQDIIKLRDYTHKDNVGIDSYSNILCEGVLFS